MSGSAPPGQLYPGQYAPPPAIAPFIVDDSATRAGRTRPQETELNLLATTLGVVAGAPVRGMDVESRARRSASRGDVEARNLAIATVGAPFTSQDLEARRSVLVRSRDDVMSRMPSVPVSMPFTLPDLETRRVSYRTREDVSVYLPPTTPVGAPFASADVERATYRARRLEELPANLSVLPPDQFAPFIAEDLSQHRPGRPASQEAWSSLLVTTLAAAPVTAPFMVPDVEKRRTVARARDEIMGLDLSLATAPVGVPFVSAEVDRIARRVRRADDVALNLVSGVLYDATQTVLREALSSVPRPWRAPSPFDAPNLLATTLAPVVPGAPFKVVDVDVARRVRSFLRASEPSGSPLLLLRVGAPFVNPDFTVRQPYATTRAVEPMGTSLAIGTAMTKPFVNPDFTVRQFYAVSRSIEPVGLPLTISTIGTVPFVKPDFAVRQPYAVTRAVEPLGMSITISTVGTPFRPGDQDGVRRVTRRVIEDFSNLLVGAPVGAAPFKPALEVERRAWRRLRQEELATEQPLLAALFISGRIRIIEAQSRIRVLTAEERARLIELQNRLRIIEAQSRGSIQ